MRMHKIEDSTCLLFIMLDLLTKIDDEVVDA